MSEPDLNPFLDGFTGGLHFIGAGGAGMVALARVAAGKGLRVTGSDLFSSPGLRALQALGAEIRIGHGEGIPDGTGAAVYSGAVSPDNPELRAARAAGVPVLHRSRLLADLFEAKRGLAVAGSHGKTSTAAILSLIARAGGGDSAFAVGGTLIGPDVNGLWGEGPFLVAEADESDASFLAYRPEGVVLTGIELDHVNRYPDLENLRRAFASFFRRIRPGGFLIHPLGEPLPLDGLEPGVRIRSFGLGPEADYRIVDARRRDWSTDFGLVAAGRGLSGLSSRVIGVIGLLNAAAAAAAAFEAGFGPDAVREGLASYRGVRRRLELKVRAGGITVIEDYAHHPTEVAGAIGAAVFVLR
ncbi:MAG TPA: Mur ligase domain-containing protein [bacterium]|nr:Mur ligase domain-containing protein [bacterium]